LDPCSCPEHQRYLTTRRERISKDPPCRQLSTRLFHSQYQHHRYVIPFVVAMLLRTLHVVSIWVTTRLSAVGISITGISFHSWRFSKGPYWSSQSFTDIFTVVHPCNKVVVGVFQGTLHVVTVVHPPSTSFTIPSVSALLPSSLTSVQEHFLSVH
jgi:hypothetical protein